MTLDAHNPAEDLGRVIAAGGITEDALRAITAIAPDSLRWFLDEARAGMVATQPLTPDEAARLAILSASLTAGLQIGDDERLAAILESLTIGCRLTPANIATLTGLDINDLETALRDPAALSSETKYGLAIRGSYLINAVNQARER